MEVLNVSDKEIRLELIQEGDFLGTKCDFYKDENNSVYMTREQIGEALQYSDAKKGIENLHSRNADRLDKFSTTIATRVVEGSREVTRDRILYVEKGVYDLCRFSRQPLADEFYDWVYDKIETIRRSAGAVDLGREKEFLDNYFPTLTEETKLMMIKDLHQSIKDQQKKIEELQPLADDWSAYMDAKGNITMAKLAKSLSINGVGRNKLFEILRNKKILRYNNEPYQKYVDDNYFKVVNGIKNGYTYTQTLVTNGGMSFINKKLREWGYDY